MQDERQIAIFPARAGSRLRAVRLRLVGGSARCDSCLGCLESRRCERARRQGGLARFAAAPLMAAALLLWTAPAAAPVRRAESVAVAGDGALPTLVTPAPAASASPEPSAADGRVGAAQSGDDYVETPEDNLRCEPASVRNSIVFRPGDAAAGARILARFDRVAASGPVKSVLDGRRVMDPIPRYAAEFRAAGLRFGVDPLALVAVSWIESRSQHYTPKGNVKDNSVHAYGVMQVLGGSKGLRYGFDVRTVAGNISAGAKYLRALLAGPAGRHGIAFSFAGYLTGGGRIAAIAGDYRQLSTGGQEYGLNARGIYDWLVAVGEGTYDPDDLPQTGGHGVGRASAALTRRDPSDRGRWQAVDGGLSANPTIAERLATGSVQGGLAGCVTVAP